MPSSKVIKRTQLCTKYDFDIWGVTSGSTKYDGLAQRLYLKPRFVNDIQKCFSIVRYKRAILKPLLKKIGFKKHLSWWKSRISQILKHRDPFPAFDRRKDMSRVLRRRSRSSALNCQSLRLKFYLGFTREFQFKKFLARCKYYRNLNLPNTLALIIDSRLPFLLIRTGLVKNYEIAHYFIRAGFVRVNETVVTDIHHVVPFLSWVRLVIPVYLKNSDYYKNRIFTYQRVSFSRHYEVNWKLLKARLVLRPNPTTFALPFFTLKLRTIGFLASALNSKLK